MKFTISWLKEHLDTSANVEEIAEALTKVGLEVEEVYNPAAKLEGFITAEIIKKDKHPDADRLNLLTVNDGKETYQVVCGAPNCYEGLKGVFAKAGTVIPVYNEALKVGNIRGIESFGMMCSEKELCLGDDHSGIIELPQDTKVGIKASEVLAIDPVIEISITPNRGDCLGVRGIARDLAAAGLGKVKPLAVKETPAKFTSPVRIKVEDFAACPTYVGRCIKGVNNKVETPKWMKDRLIAIGLKSISPLVDVTNYINYDLCRPLHVFDADKLKGNIVVRMAKEGEKFTSLEGKLYELDNKCLGICDDDGVECLGGIMGGLEKSCSAETTSVLLECATFNPEVISRTGRKYNIESDSRYRYERGIDPSSNKLGSDYAAGLILEICGGEASDIMIEGLDKAEERAAYTTIEKIKSFAGIDVTKEQVVEILSHLEFKVSVEGDKIKAVIPSWRNDVAIESDIIEEVVRMYGLDNIPALSLPTEKFPTQTLTVEQRRVVTAKHELAGRGMYETVTWSFTDSSIGKYFRKSQDEILLSNPIAADLDEMRQSILPNLLIGVRNNIARGYSDVSIFEVGPEFYGRKPLEQKTVTAGIRSGKTSKKSWIGDVREYDVFDAKADAMAVIAAANGPYDNAQITADAPQYYHPGRSGVLRLGKNVLAYFGELHPSILKKLGVKQRVAAFEVYMDNIPVPRGAASKAKKKLELSQFQPVDKDFAFVVDKDVPAANVIMAAKGADKESIADVRVFDLYEGANLSAGKKSLAISVTFQPKEKTYTDQEIETLMNKVIVAVGQKTGGVIRA
ncbi:MAG: phenylalanine--tRNA ligase subunit beta [Lactobacillaceae bacterium]|jgi:phenylalanyl-tRNA synthetase beta chain|nr:phenylalanine--tRNA ligase subunit beta [Lactobacillaceae bacterium]